MLYIPSIPHGWIFREKSLFRRNQNRKRIKEKYKKINSIPPNEIRTIMRNVAFIYIFFDSSTSNIVFHLIRR